ncbi:MAG: energy-coupling factor transporter ATPase [Firmicutes bacterium]|nr:energy-coupling factor transporter ATPase [Bacillota bacterium]
MSNIIEIQGLNYTYLPGSPYEHRALRDISLSLGRGEFLGVFGPNSSGKSTLAKHLNGLVYPTSGTVRVCGIDTSVKEQRTGLWKKVGLVFQYPEQQIFEASVYDEVSYGPRNLGLDESEIRDRVHDALEKVGLAPDPTSLLSPINLSGGIRRRVAIAGILALHPEIMVLDEPMAGLDPRGRRLVLDIINRRRENRNETTVMISHNLKEILALADKIAILDRGALVFFGGVGELQADSKLLARFRFELPDYLQVVQALADRGIKVDTGIKDMNEAGSELIRVLSERRQPQTPSP